MSPHVPTRLSLFTGCLIAMSARGAVARPEPKRPDPVVEPSAAASLAAEETAAAAGSVIGTGVASALCGGLWLSGADLRDAASGAVLWSDASVTPTSLACTVDEGGRIVAVGGARGAR